MVRKLEVDHLKPPKFKHYLTLGELSRRVKKDRDWIRRLEREGRIPEGIRHRVAGQQIRLYPPARVREIEEFFSNQRPGRPKGS